MRTVNASGVFLALKHVLPVMVEGGGGAVINTSSINGLKGSPGQIAYVASEHAVAAMTRSSAREWAARAARVNAIASGAIKGRMLMNFFEHTPPPDRLPRQTGPLRRSNGALTPDASPIWSAFLLPMLPAT